MAESNVQLNNNSTPGARIGTITRVEGADTVHTQGVAIVDPDTGDVRNTALESTQVAIQNQLNVTLSSLRDAITGIGGAAKTLADVVTQLTTQVKSTQTDLQTARDARVSLVGALHVGNRQVVFSDFFADGIDAAKWATAASGTAAASTATNAGAITFATGTTANSGITFTGARALIAIAGSTAVMQCGVTIPDGGTANNIRRWGAFDASNGYFWELDGAALYAVSRKAGVDTRVAAAAADMTVNRLYEIEYQGNTAVFLRERVAVATLSGAVALPRTANINFPLRFENVNANGSTTNVSMLVRGCSISRTAGLDPEQGFWSYYAGTSGTVVVAAGQRVVGITAVATSNGVTMSINGIATVPIPNNSALEIRPKGQLIAPTITFTGTASYFVEVVG